LIKLLYLNDKFVIMQEAYIVAGFRTAVTKSKRGGFRFTRPDDLAIEVIKGLMASATSTGGSKGR
jgi:acetyl-CoA acetyltransferase